MATREANTAVDQRLDAASPSNRFYRTVWRWHFYAGLFVIPFMLILGTTGIIYLFKPQLDAAMYSNLMFVQPGAATLPYAQQVQVAQSAYPEATITKFTPQVAPNRSAEAVLTTADDRSVAVFVNPYSGKVLGDRDENNNLQAIARKIHGELFMGVWGDRLVELAASWALVLLISGAYLWFPRNNLSLMGTVIPRLLSQNKRIFWRDLHAVPGFYGVLLIGFLILTGLPWTGFWGDTFAQVWGRFPAEMWDDVPQSAMVTGALNQRGDLFVPWAAEQMPMPLSTLAVANSSGDHSATLATDSKESSSDIAAVFNQVVDLALKEGAPPGFSVAFPEGETGVYTVSAFPDDPRQEVTMHMDQYSGKLLAIAGWKDYGIVPKAVEMGVAIHMGKFFGLANQLLMLFAALVTIFLAVTGTLLWWQRRPQGSGFLGAPEMPPYVQNWKVPLIIVAVMGMLFPFVGLSLAAVLLLDFWVLSRVPWLKRLFG